MPPEAVTLLVHEWHVHLIGVEKRPTVFVGFANLNAGAGTRLVAHAQAADSGGTLSSESLGIQWEAILSHFSLRN